MSPKVKAVIMAAVLLYGGANWTKAQSNVKRREMLSVTVNSSAAAGATVNHSVTLTWVASTSASCLTSTPATCTAFGYNVYRGTASGGESITPENSTPIIGTSFVDSVTLPASGTQTFYYVVEAVETSSADGLTYLSVPSNEVSATFQAPPQPPTNVTATKQ